MLPILVLKKRAVMLSILRHDVALTSVLTYLNDNHPLGVYMFCDDNTSVNNINNYFQEYNY